MIITQKERGITMFNLIFIIICIGLICYMSYNIFTLTKRNKKNRRLITLFDTIDNENVFFKMCDEFIDGVNDKEFVTKGLIFKLWGLARYQRFDEFKETLDKVDLSTMIYRKQRLDGAELNEDSFYYICIGIPHALYINKRLDLLKLVQAKIDTVKPDIDNRLVKVIGDHNYKYYYKEDDLGRSFYEAVLDGNYSQYKYSKQLIGMFKSIVSCMLGRIYLDNDEKDKYENVKPDIINFDKSKLGKTLIKELNLDISEKEKSDE